MQHYCQRKQFQYTKEICVAQLFRIDFEMLKALNIDK